jgi:hypothetical protein
MADEYDSSSDEDLQYESQPHAAKNKFEETAAAGYESLAKQEDSLLGDKVTIIFILPSGERITQEFRMGHSVEWLKQAVEDKTGLKYHSTKLMFGGKLMMDPLSLCDIKGLKSNAENEVEVTVVA